jgi:hypothetical protein
LSGSKPSAPPLDDDLLEQDGGDMVRRDRQIDAPGQLLFQPIEPGGAVEVGRPQLAQVGLEGVHHPRHQRLNLLHQLLVRQLQHDLHLEVLRAVAAAVGQVDQHIRHVDEHGGLGLRLGRLVVPGFAEKQVGARTATAEHQQAAGRHDDELQRELLFGLGGRGGIRIVRLVRFRLFGLGRH